MKKDISKIGAQLFTVREFMKTPKDIAETFKKIRAIGYETVQFSGQPIGDASELRKMADDAGIKIVCTHIPYDSFKNNLSKVISDHKTIGATHAGLGMMPEKFRNSEEGAVEFAKEFDAIAREMKAEGLGGTYHNHCMEFARFGGKTVMDLLMENSQYFSFMLDTYWVQAGGADVADFIRKHKDRLELVHLKDMCIAENKQVMCEVLEGNLNWNSILNELESTDVEYAFVEQDICARDPFDCLRTSYENLKKLLED